LVIWLVPPVRAQGKTNMAIQLERLLRELAKTDEIDVPCGCAIETYDLEQEKDIIERICAEHSSVH